MTSGRQVAVRHHTGDRGEFPALAGNPAVRPLGRGHLPGNSAALPKGHAFAVAPPVLRG